MSEEGGHRWERICQMTLMRKMVVALVVFKLVIGRLGMFGLAFHMWNP